MGTDEVDETVTTREPVTPGSPEAMRTVSQRTVTAPSPGRPETTRRVLILMFGLIQIFIGLRIVLLLLDAREANGLVSAILNISQLFVAPFDGILRTDALHAAGSILDITAIVAIIGWTILEVIINWAIAIFRRQSV